MSLFHSLVKDGKICGCDFPAPLARFDDMVGSLYWGSKLVDACMRISGTFKLVRVIAVPCKSLDLNPAEVRSSAFGRRGRWRDTGYDAVVCE
jgi:hypothetical protein